MNGRTRKVIWIILGGGSILLLVLMAGRMLSTVSALSALSPDERMWPMSAGQVWIYQGEVRWSDPRDGRVLSKTVEYPMRILDVVQRGALQAAVVEGHPQDMAWAGGEADLPPPEKYMIIEAAQGIFWVQGLRVAEVLPRIRDKSDPLTGLLRSEELLVRPGMTVGETVARRIDDEQPDDFYRWVVAETPRPLRVAEDVVPPGAESFRLLLRTLPDDTAIDFVPGVGMVSYHYRHHGTVAEADLSLARVHHEVEF